MTQWREIYDNPPCRRGTDCVKYDSLQERYGSAELIPLWVADMDFPVAKEISDAIIERCSHPVYGYHRVPDSYWRAVVRWISKGYGFTPLASELSYIPGIVRGIGYAINYYTAPGDRILIFSPVYHPFKMLTEGNGRVCVEEPLKTDPATGRFEIDFESLERRVEEQKPVMMILCNPHNPGGRQWSLDELRKIASVAARHNVIVISDEIHGDLMLDGKVHNSYFSAGEDAVKTGIMFGAPSKTFNIPGLVSSWIVTRNPELRDGFYKWLEVNEFNAPTFYATVSTEAAYEFGREWLGNTLRYIEENMDYLESRIDEIAPIKSIRPDASYLVWLDCRALGLDQESLNRLFIDAGLALNDGAMFGKEGEGYMRLNVALSRMKLGTAIDNLRNAVENLKKNKR